MELLSFLEGVVCGALLTLLLLLYAAHKALCMLNDNPNPNPNPNLTPTPKAKAGAQREASLTSGEAEKMFRDAKLYQLASPTPAVAAAGGSPSPPLSPLTLTETASPVPAGAASLGTVEEDFQLWSKLAKERQKDMKSMSTFMQDLSSAHKSFAKALHKISKSVETAMKEERLQGGTPVKWWLAMSGSMTQMSLLEEKTADFCRDEFSQRLSDLLEQQAIIENKLTNEGLKVIRDLREGVQNAVTVKRSRDEIVRKVQSLRDKMLLDPDTKVSQEQKWAKKLVDAEAEWQEASMKLKNLEEKFKDRMPRIERDFDMLALNGRKSMQDLLLKFTQQLLTTEEQNRSVIFRMRVDVSAATLDTGSPYDSMIEQTLREFEQSEGTKPAAPQLDMGSDAMAAIAAALPAALPPFPAALDDAISPETCVWFNALMGRVYRDVARSEHFREWLLKKLHILLNKGSRPEFIDELSVSNIRFGAAPPLLKNTKWVPVRAEAGCDPNYDVLLTSDVIFRGGLGFTVSTKLCINWPRDRYAFLPVQVDLELSEFSGKLKFGVTRNQTFISFMEEPFSRFTVHSTLGHQYKVSNVPKIHEIIVKRIKKSIRNRLVQPRSFKFRLIWPNKWWPPDENKGTNAPQTAEMEPERQEEDPNASPRAKGNQSHGQLDADNQVDGEDKDSASALSRIKKIFKKKPEKNEDSQHPVAQVPVVVAVPAELSGNESAIGPGGKRSMWPAWKRNKPKLGTGEKDRVSPADAPPQDETQTIREESDRIGPNVDIIFEKAEHNDFSDSEVEEDEIDGDDVDEGGTTRWSAWLDAAQDHFKATGDVAHGNSPDKRRSRWPSLRRSRSREHRRTASTPVARLSSPKMAMAFAESELNSFDPLNRRHTNTRTHTVKRSCSLSDFRTESLHAQVNGNSDFMRQQNRCRSAEDLCMEMDQPYTQTLMHTHTQPNARSPDGLTIAIARTSSMDDSALEVRKPSTMQSLFLKYTESLAVPLPSRELPTFRPHTPTRIVGFNPKHDDAAMHAYTSAAPAEAQDKAEKPHERPLSHNIQTLRKLLNSHAHSQRLGGRKQQDPRPTEAVSSSAAIVGAREDLEHVVHSGYLKVHKGLVSLQAKRRWCVLTGTLLSIYSKEGETHPWLALDVNSITCRLMDNGVSLEIHVHTAPAPTLTSGSGAVADEFPEPSPTNAGTHTHTAASQLSSSPNSSPAAQKSYPAVPPISHWRNATEIIHAGGRRLVFTAESETIARSWAAVLTLAQTNTHTDAA